MPSRWSGPDTQMLSAAAVSALLPARQVLPQPTPATPAPRKPARR